MTAYRDYPAKQPLINITLYSIIIFIIIIGVILWIVI